MTQSIYSFILSFCIILIILTGCNKKPPQNEIPKLQVTSLALEKKTPIYDSTYLSLDSLNNAMIYDEDSGWLRLKNRSFVTDSDKVMGHVDIGISDSFTFADLDSDGYKDAIGSIGVNNGGSGRFISMAIFLNKHGSAIHTASYSIGDRIAPDSIIVVGDTINLFYKERTKEEAMASGGSIPIHKKLQLVGNKIIELE